MCVCASMFHEEVKRGHSSDSLHCLSEKKQVAPDDPSPSHLETQAHTHISPHHTSIPGVQVLIPSVSMVSG